MRSHFMDRNKSAQWKHGRFANPEPMKNDYFKALLRSFRADPHGVPKEPLPVIQVDATLFSNAPKSGLRMTWLGHSSFIVEVDGFRFLMDPVWSKRSSIFQWVGPKRWYAPLLSLAQVPELDAVFISHNHYDHLDRLAIEGVAAKTHCFIVPIGVGQTLVDWGIDPAKITELDWWGATRIGQIEITATPARHASGRGILDQGKSLWMGFALHGPKHRVFYSGDTGPQRSAAEIGARLGPFDLTMIECGQYDEAWPDWHMMPEQTLAMHKAVRGKVLIPVHWGLFRLAYHSWKDPVERLTRANADGAETILIPRPGESVEPTQGVIEPDWWKTLRSLAEKESD